jgi:hypothetical protein
MKLIAKLALAILISPSICWASGSGGGYIALGFLLSIPSFVVIGCLIVFIFTKSKKPEFQASKVCFICFVVLVPAGFSISANGVLYPNLVGFAENRFLPAISSALIMSFLLLLLYKIKWEREGGKIENED